MLFAFGLLAALIEVRNGGSGQIVDAAMVDGLSLLMTRIHDRRAIGAWDDRRGFNLEDGGAPFYNVYETADSKYLAVGAVEAKFYSALIQCLDLDPESLPAQHDRNAWPTQKALFAERFASRPQAEWVRIASGTDACITPVLPLGEVAQHPHHIERESFFEVGSVLIPRPAPRFSNYPNEQLRPPSDPGDSTDVILQELGYARVKIEKLHGERVVA
jgi:alpha-methylacyl-CoA racemase